MADVPLTLMQTKRPLSLYGVQPACILVFICSISKRHLLAYLQEMQIGRGRFRIYVWRTSRCGGIFSQHLQTRTKHISASSLCLVSSWISLSSFHQTTTCAGCNLCHRFVFFFFPPPSSWIQTLGDTDIFSLRDVEAARIRASLKKNKKLQQANQPWLRSLIKYSSVSPWWSVCACMCLREREGALLSCW